MLNAIANETRYDQKMAELWAACVDFNNQWPEGTAVEFTLAGQTKQSTLSGPATVIGQQIVIPVDSQRDSIAIERITRVWAV